MDLNQIVTDTWSNQATKTLYESEWPDEPALREACREGEKQCGGCSFFAPFNEDWGLCANARSRHHLETVFEHFACPAFVNEGWGPHSFTDEASFHCRCGGEGSEYWDQIAKLLPERPTDGTT
ncbi:MAG TPA: hypothetical protein VEA69_20065 [Tepidisphaeraceae bacterium]|nr:hypothetical protein [Tepidisphaeraceae bacterium]